MGDPLRPPSGHGVEPRKSAFLELCRDYTGFSSPPTREPGTLGRMPDLTRLLAAAAAGDRQAAADLLPVVYDDLRMLAALKIAREKPGQTLQATALVHEAYLRVVGLERAQHWDSRRHFFAAAAEAMRRILVDQARHKQSRKGGGGRRRLPLDGVNPPVSPAGEPPE